MRVIFLNFKTRASLRLLKIGEHVEYEIEPSLLKEAQGVYEDVRRTFEQYPEFIRWRPRGEKNLLLGILGECIFDVILDELQIPHIWNRYIIQNQRIKKRKKALPDFIVGEYTLEVKVGTSKSHPESFYINYKRWLKNPSELVVFLWIPEDLNTARICGWVEREDLEGYKPEEAGFSTAIRIPKSALKDPRTLFSLLQGGGGRE